MHHNLLIQLHCGEFFSLIVGKLLIKEDFCQDNFNYHWKHGNKNWKTNEDFMLVNMQFILYYNYLLRVGGWSLMMLN